MFKSMLMHNRDSKEIVKFDIVTLCLHCAYNGDVRRRLLWVAWRWEW